MTGTYCAKSKLIFGEVTTQAHRNGDIRFQHRETVCLVAPGFPLLPFKSVRDPGVISLLEVYTLPRVESTHLACNEHQSSLGIVATVCEGTTAAAAETGL